MNSTCPNPNRCLFAGCNGDCQPARIAACVSPSLRDAGNPFAAETSPERAAPLSFRCRDARTHRKLLVAALG